jgi:hypothetical protein
MRKTSWFKTEAKWTAAIHYLLLATGLLAILIELIIGWVKAAG